MADTPNYNSNKEIHDLVTQLQKLPRSDYLSNFRSDLHEEVSNFLHGKKDKKTGKVQWSKNGGEKAHKEFTDKLWEKAAMYVAKNHLHWSDEDIKKFKGMKTQFGASFWETTMAPYLGHDKKGFYEKFKNQDELTVDQIMEAYVGRLHDNHYGHCHGEIVTVKKDKMGENEFKEGVEKYHAMAKEHNKEALKPMKKRKLTSIDDAIGVISETARRLPESYHPDKPDSYT